MKKIVIVCGLIAGFIVTIMMVITVSKCYRTGNFDGSLMLGYATMLLAFSLIFVGIKNYRDKQANGIITFGKAFRIGLYISLIASSIYVGVWLISYYTLFPDFMERYTEHVIKQTQSAGATQVEINAKTAEMADYKEMYKNPLLIILLTYAEILPLGLVVTLICALILKEK